MTPATGQNRWWPALVDDPTAAGVAATVALAAVLLVAYGTRNGSNVGPDSVRRSRAGLRMEPAGREIAAAMRETA